jgi:hypothetical protein
MQKTKDMALTWNPARSLEPPNILYYHSDGSYTGEGLQSRMGFVGLLNGGAVIAENGCPKFQCTGVFDIEEAASYWAARDIVYRKAFLTELGCPQPAWDRRAHRVLGEVKIPHRWPCELRTWVATTDRVGCHISSRCRHAIVCMLTPTVMVLYHCAGIL